MSETRAPTWRECAEALRDVLSGGKFDKETLGVDVAYALIGADLIRREEQKKPCRTCGTPQHDFSYWRVTAAGRMLVAALQDPTA